LGVKKTFFQVRGDHLRTSKAYLDIFRLGLRGVSILAVPLATDTFMAGLAEPSKF